ncbi:hypothetical protein F5148DRAFT_1274317 [Russula earlei]|uniref:Uncharacterized protein n=1 Tax=Russula earlei TaxID=71964 RepID=A0ACC0UI90_9AGAM|nr:hypothetical protein F5148DRAFT_1274317 [Russula earlei]
MSAACTPAHDWFSNVLTGGLILGLCISYAPQHYRIISKGSSEGFSPWFLLLGSTSSASGMLNMVVMQQAVIKCCRFYSSLDCLETIAGVIQVGTQWFLFTIILVLYLIYFPPHLKYVTLDIDADESRPSERSDSWRLSVILSWIVFIHLSVFSLVQRSLAFCTFVTFLLLLSSPSGPSGVVRSQLSIWATFLGVSSAVLAALQYTPQIAHTYRLQLVGALSIPMMLIQTPGGVIMVISIMIRGRWIMFLVAAIMQGILLVMCLCWKVRQRRLHIDDFGHPLRDSPLPPLPITSGLGDGESVAEDSMEEDVISITPEEAERSPLLNNRKRRKISRRKWWSKWLGTR